MNYQINYEEKPVNLKINAKRTLYGIGHIGYSPAKAILDIMDNSLENGATNGWIFINRIDTSKQKSLNNIKEILVIDDGNGMTEEEVYNALALGSSDEPYREKSNSLSKFGMGLKSAASSLGNKFDVISVKNGFLTKVTVDQNDIGEEYVGRLRKPTEEDIALLDKYQIEHGTIIRVYDIYEDEHPSYAKIIDDLNEGQNAIGIVYYYLLRDGKRHVYLEGEEVPARDVLLEDEAVGDLDETTWNGCDVSYLQRETNIELPTESGKNITIKLTAMQFPHTRSRHYKKGEDNSAIIRKYGVKTNNGNAGYYVYRNGRLISWADKLHENLRNYIFNDVNTLKLEGFRGRICITSDADKAFGIDVTKSKIQLSHETFGIINSVADAIQQKSAKAFENASNSVSNNAKSNVLSNDTAKDINEEAYLPNEPLSSPSQEDEIRENKKVIEEEAKKRIKNEVENTLAEEDPDKDYSEEEIEEKTKEYIADNITKRNERILLVPKLEDGMLFEPFYDAKLGVTVRINKNHRFARMLYLNSNNEAYKYLQMFMEFIFFECIEAEYRVLSKLEGDAKKKDYVRRKFFDYRQNLSFELEREVREKGDIFNVNFEFDDI